KFADLVVDIGDVGEIALPRAPDLFGRDGKAVVVAGLVQALRMRVLLGIGNEADFRFQRRAILVQVPVFAPRDIGVVWMGEGNRQAPGAPRGIVGSARKFVEFLLGVEGYFVVIFHLVGDLGDARAGNGTQIVIPPVDTL